MNHEWIMPTIVSEYIDEVILPDLANGQRSSGDIVEITAERAYDWLINEVDKQEPVSDEQTLTYCWLVARNLHRELMRVYINRAFEEWGGQTYE